MSDPNWADVDFLYSFDGTNGATSFTDAKGNTTATGYGGIALSNAQSKWGTTSLDLDGTDDYLELTDATLDLTGDYTLEFWWQPKLALQTGWIVDWLPSFYSAAWQVPRFKFTNNGAILYFYGGVQITSGNIVTAAQWYHVAATRESGTHRLYVDGNQVGGTINNATTNATLQGRPTVGRRGASSGEFAKGYVSDLRVTLGVARYTGSTYTVPAAAFPTSGASATDVNVGISGPLGSLQSVVDAPGADREARVVLPSPLDLVRANVLQDFTGLITDPVELYVAKLTGSPEITIPISSWQATLQTNALNFLQVVIPAADSYLAALTARRGTEEIVVYRRTNIQGSVFESEMARCGVDDVSFNTGPTNSTATVRGYTSAFDNPVSPGTVTLQNIRSRSQTLGGAARVRCSIDWLLRPGQTVTDSEITFTAGYINYFVPTTGDSYMDVGSRG